MISFYYFIHVKQGFFNWQIIVQLYIQPTLSFYECISVETYYTLLLLWMIKLNTILNLNSITTFPSPLKIHLVTRQAKCDRGKSPHGSHYQRCTESIIFHSLAYYLQGWGWMFNYLAMAARETSLHKLHAPACNVSPSEDCQKTRNLYYSTITSNLKYLPTLVVIL